MPNLDQHELERKLEEYKGEMAKDLELYKARQSEMLTVWRSAIEFGQIAVRSIILANGAGAIGIIGFLGNAQKNSAPTIAHATVFVLSIAAGIFAAGVASGLLATIFAYISQYKFALTAGDTRVLDINKVNIPERRFAVVFVFIGIALFFIGVLTAALAYSW